MRFGIAVFPADYAADPATIGRLVEERRFESLFFSEHTHIPVGGEHSAKRRGRAAAANTAAPRPVHRPHRGGRVTERLRLGTGVSLVIQRDPIVTAKAVATLDLLSGGRVEFGVGAGWNREEMRTTDPVRPPLRRHARAGRGDEGHLDAGRRHLPRKARRVRRHRLLAEARPAAPAGADRRNGERVLQRVLPTATAGSRTARRPGSASPELRRAPPTPAAATSRSPCPQARSRIAS